MTKYHSNRTDCYFWLGASAEAETGSRASTEPSCTVSALTGFDPARKALEDAADEILKIPVEVIEKHLDRAYVIIQNALDACPTCAHPTGRRS